MSLGHKLKVRSLALPNTWPVVQRELREAARRPANRRLRLISASVGTLLLWVITANFPMPAAQLGGYLFGSLHTLLMGLILLIVPALTADCIAREKREGTLGLLFMTPLSASGIVAGKALGQGLRAFTLWLAVLPILTIPFLTGGVTLGTALRELSLEFCAAVLCLAAGLLASSLAKHRTVAFLLAFALAAIFLMTFAQLFIIAFSIRPTPVFGGAPPPEAFTWNLFLIFILSGADALVGGNMGSGIIRMIPGMAELLKWLCVAGPPVALLLFYVVARYAAWRVELSWQDKVPSRRRERLAKRYSTPLFSNWWRRRMQRSLDRNPIAWLQQYSWKARAAKWGLCAIFIIIEGTASSGRPEISDIVQTPLLVTLAGVCTFIGVSGFLEEKRSGALELLLVTPISVNKLIFGRVWGLWKQFLPAALILLIFALLDFLAGSSYDYFRYSRGRWFGEAFPTIFAIACAFLSLPVFATYFALRVKNLVFGAVLTWISLGAPSMLAAETTFFFSHTNDLNPVLVLLSYSAFVALTCFMLRHSLSRRIYSF
jgi:ABC-type Na+ efflux pump permease subunit